MRRFIWATGWLVLAAVSAQGQGRTDYFNTETVQVDPLAIVQVGGKQFLAVANSPDNAVELYRTEETLPISGRFVARVRTGLEPASLLWVPELSRLYVANALSDAITVIRLDPGPNGVPVVTVEQTNWVGDEPVALAYYAFEEALPGGGTTTRHSLFVAHRDQDGLGWRDALTLAPILPGVTMVDATVQKGDLDQDGQPDLIAIKAPRDVDARCGRVFLLSEKGGNTQHFNFDLYSLPVAGGAAQDLALPNSANFQMAWSTTNDLFIVGGEALNTSLRDEPVVAAAPTGFVKSTLTMVRGLCTGTPSVKTRDVNLEALVPVSGAKALAQLTGVAVFRPSTGPLKVFVTAFSSDRIGVVEADWATSADSWPIRRIDIPVLAGAASPDAGPRALVVKGADPTNPLDPGARLYVLNRHTNSVSILNPVSEAVLGQFALRHDPVPAYIRAGQTFLYSAKRGNGFNSCSSCHIDGRTDGLAWDLGDGVQQPIPPLLKDNPLMPNFWPGDKEMMVTQSLQGLLNYEVEPESQDLFTNAPYHWRGDRETFQSFNPAFAGLLGGKELDDAEIAAFEEYINSVNYPPNPRQPLGRTHSGEPFVDETFEAGLPTGAQMGLALYHLFPSDLGMSCAHCHALPEGSNNKITERIAGSNPFDLLEPMPTQGMETAALRGLFQKEARLTRSGAVDPDLAPITGLEGLFHTGFVQPAPGLGNVDFNRTSTINAFNRNFFGSTLCPPGQPFCQLIQDLNQFVHELDWGVAPLAGLPYTVTPANLGSPITLVAFQLTEGQTLAANTGLAVQAFLGTAERGFWFDPRIARYVEEPAGAVLDRTGLLALMGAGDRLVLVATPLGTERRVAAPNGQPSLPGGGAPSGVKLVGMAPSTPYEKVPLMTLNWQDPALPSHGGFFSHSVRLLQTGIRASAGTGNNLFGVGIRWEAPRRFRVAAAGVRPGARLVLFSHNDPANPFQPPITTLRPGQAGQVGLRSLTLPLHPSGDVDPTSGLPIYETAAELDPREYLRLIAGGPFAPAVQAAVTDATFAFTEVPLAPALVFNAARWNLHYVRIENPNGLRGDGGWQRLFLE
jgi:hypothetical protein